MKIGKRMEKALNEQINKELYSAYIYLSMSAYFDKENFSGFAHWMKKQANEEIEHAMKIYHYIYERGGSVQLKAIDEPDLKWNSPLEVFEGAYEHEKHVTDLINKLVDLAIEEDDKATQVFLNWFVNEQVEEEASADEIVEKLKMIGDSAQGLIMLDKVLGQRE